VGVSVIPGRSARDKTTRTNQVNAFSNAMKWIV